MYSGSPRIGLALSGGTLKAAAHVGVIGALEQIGIRPQLVAGTSAGSFVAALYAHGYTTNELCQLVESFPGLKVFDYGYPLATSLVTLVVSSLTRGRYSSRVTLPNGLLRGRRLYRYFAASLEDRQLSMPLYIVATDALSGQPVTFSNDHDLVQRGLAEAFVDIPSALAGSCSLPGLLTPVQLGDHLLIDGGYRHYVPVEVLRSVECDAIIAVNLHQLDTSWRPNTFIDVLARSFEILLQESIDNDVAGDDLLVIQPQLEGISFVSFGEMKSCVAVGQRTAQEQQDQILSFIQKHTSGNDCGSGTSADHRSPVIRIQGSRI